MSLLRKILCAVFISFICSIASAETFVIKSIRVNGLQRISVGTVLSYLAEISVKEGERIDTSETPDIIRALYKTNFFSEVSLTRSNDDLIISVVERSVIGSLNITGNSKITKKQLIEALKTVGIFEGQALDPAVLNAIQHAITHEYYNKGLYSVKVNIDIQSEKRNRSAVAIKIHEGPTAKIKSIKIVGNKVFKEKTLLKEFSLATTKLWSFITDSDKYSQEKMYADLEKLRSYYMDRGYLHVKIDTPPKVSITPDRKSIYIVISLTEGEVYKLGGFELGGDLLGKRTEVLKLVQLKPGSIFSRKDVIDAQSAIKLFLGDYGYGMADIRDESTVDEKNNSVRIKFIVIPGHRVYVRNINFSGNHKTNDEVLRREMRLQEGSLFSLSKINESSRRLANLGYLQDVDHEVIPVADSNNQVDLLYKAKETSAIGLQLQGGYSDREGWLYGTSISDQNVFGTGKTTFLGFDNSKATQYYKVGYYDPYFTINKIGLSLGGHIRKTNPNKISGELSSYTNSIYAGEAFFDVPLSDDSQYGFGLGIEHIAINRTSRNPHPKAEDFLNANGTSFNQFKLMGSWSYSYFDRAPFPTKGFGHSIGVEVYGPLNRNSLEFYTAEYKAALYVPLFTGFIFSANADFGYGDGFGKTKDLLFLKNFMAGGIGSVRGFESNTLSNDEGKYKNQVIGGNILTLASASIIIPNPFQDILRPRVFIDVGNVYDNYFKFGDLRSSYGIQLEWRTPLSPAPLVFSVARPLRKKSWDDRSLFQFSIGGSI